MAKTPREGKAKKPRRPAMTPEGRENQLISLAVDLAEKQLLDGSASAQVITHYLKLGTTRASLEKEKLERENELLKAKTESLKAQQRNEEMFKQAIDAMRMYSGSNEDADDEVDIF